MYNLFIFINNVSIRFFPHLKLCVSNKITITNLAMHKRIVSAPLPGVFSVYFNSVCFASHKKKKYNYR